jgi:hypothetical protein
MDIKTKLKIFSITPLHIYENGVRKTEEYNKLFSDVKLFNNKYYTITFGKVRMFNSRADLLIEPVLKDTKDKEYTTITLSVMYKDFNYVLETTKDDYDGLTNNDFIKIHTEEFTQIGEKYNKLINLLINLDDKKSKESRKKSTRSLTTSNEKYEMYKLKRNINPKKRDINTELIQ